MTHLRTGLKPVDTNVTQFNLYLKIIVSYVPSIATYTALPLVVLSCKRLNLHLIHIIIAILSVNKF